MHLTTEGKTLLHHFESLEKDINAYVEQIRPQFAKERFKKS